MAASLESRGGMLELGPSMRGENAEILALSMQDRATDIHPFSAGLDCEVQSNENYPVVILERGSRLLTHHNPVALSRFGSKLLKGNFELDGFERSREPSTEGVESSGGGKGRHKPLYTWLRAM